MKTWIADCLICEFRSSAAAESLWLTASGELGCSCSCLGFNMAIHTSSTCSTKAAQKIPQNNIRQYDLLLLCNCKLACRLLRTGISQALS